MLEKERAARIRLEKALYSRTNAIHQDSQGGGEWAVSRRTQRQLTFDDRAPEEALEEIEKVSGLTYEKAFIAVNRQKFITSKHENDWELDTSRPDFK